MNGYVISLKELGYIYQDIREIEEKERKIEEKRSKERELNNKRKTGNSKFALDQEKIKKRDQKIIELWDSDKNLTYREIAEILLRQWYWLDEDDVVRVIALEKQRRYAKENTDLAKEIVKLVYSKKATLEQLKQMAEYYGVNLEDILDALDDKNKSNGKDER